MSGKKAWMRMFEVVLAIAMMAGYLAHMEHTFTEPASSLSGNIETAKIAQDILVTLDLLQEENTTFLRNCLATANYTRIEEKTREILSRNYLFSYSIGDHTTRQMPRESKNAAASYFIYDRNDTKPICYQVRLSIWSVG